MKVAVITGAASGIGLALAQVHLQQGHTVVMVDKDKLKLKAQALSFQKNYPGLALYQSCDVCHAMEVKELALYVKSQFESIDWLYNNAGIIGPIAPIWELEIEAITRVMDVNLYGMIHLIQAFMPLLLAQERPSHLINMASLYALCTGAQLSAYSMSKHAVLALSESLYFDLLPLQKAINVSVVFPSFTDTALLNTPTKAIDPFHNTLQQLLTHSRPALDVAKLIVEAVDKKEFYIFPDKEVKGYCEGRTTALINQENPHVTNIEKLMNSLRKRTCKP